MKKVGVLDVGCGNINSVAYSFQIKGSAVEILSQSPKKDNFDLIILPGVGSAGSAEKKLHKNFKSWILERVDQKKSFLGICLGFQLMFESTEESGGVEGLAIFKGKTQMLSNFDNVDMRVGWFKQSINNLIFDKAKRDFYFNHCYGINKKKFVKKKNYKFGTLDQCVTWVVDNNVMGFQFHPEKSQYSGVKLINNILNTL